MDVVDLYQITSSITGSPVFIAVMEFIVVYVIILWVSMIIWTTRDIITRSDNIVHQMISILIVTGLGPLGVPVYLAIRPEKTLGQRYDEELERKAFLDAVARENLICDNCHSPVREEMVYCPSCKHKLKSKCKSCGMVLDRIWSYCPGCSTAAPEEKK